MCLTPPFIFLCTCYPTKLTDVGLPATDVSEAMAGSQEEFKENRKCKSPSKLSYSIWPWSVGTAETSQESEGGQMSNTGDKRIQKHTGVRKYRTILEVSNISRHLWSENYKEWYANIIHARCPCLNGPWYKTFQQSLIFSDASKQTSCFGVQQWLPLKWSLDKTNQNKWSLSGSLASIDPFPYLHQPALMDQVLQQCEGCATKTRCRYPKIGSSNNSMGSLQGAKMMGTWSADDSDWWWKDSEVHRSQKLLNRWDQYIFNI